MFIKGEWFKTGWLYFIIMFVLEATLPEWSGEENGVIENLQMLWLFGGFYLCFKARNAIMCNWGGTYGQLMVWRYDLLFPLNYARDKLGAYAAYSF